jgi:outer membrane protein assembly factor BamE
MPVLPLWMMICLLFFLLQGCGGASLIAVNRPDIRQGNALSAEATAAITVGMSQAEVIQRLGNPLLIETFAQKRWHYVYTFAPGKGSREAQRLTIDFDQNGRVVAVDRV